MKIQKDCGRQEQEEVWLASTDFAAPQVLVNGSGLPMHTRKFLTQGYRGN